MTAQLYNNVTDSLLDPVTTELTEITVLDGTKFNDLADGDYTPLYVIQDGGAHEIMHITGVAGDTLQVMRGQEGTDPLNFSAGSTVQVRPTRQSLLEQDASGMSVSSGGGAQRTASQWADGAVYTFDSVADMQAADWLVVSQKVRTLGYYEPGDGGGCDYEIVSAGTGTNYGFLYEELTGIDLEAKFISGGIMEDKAVFIPTDYSTIGGAINTISNILVNSSSEVVINLETGFVMSEQVIVEGVDLSFIRITSADTEVTIDRSSLTIEAGIWAFGERFPAFLGRRNAKLPEIDALFNMDTSGAGTGRSGILCLEGSSVFVHPGSGVMNANGVGLFCIDSSFAVANGSIFTGSGGTGIASWRGSVIQANRADVSNGLTYGVSASQARLVFVDGIADNCGRHGIRADEGAVLTCRGASAINSGSRGVYAWRSSTIMAEGVDVTGSSVGFAAHNGSTIICRFGIANNCTTNSIIASESSTVDAGNVFGGSAFSGIDSGGDGVLARYNSRVCVYGGADLSGASGDGIKVQGGATVDAKGANLSGCLNGVSAIDAGSCVDVSFSTITGCTENSVVSQSSSTINAQGATATGAGSRGCYALYGSSVNIRDAEFQKGESPSTSDIVVKGGAIISANGATGGLIQTANTITGDGIIFQ